MSIKDQVEAAQGREKFDVLAAALDELAKSGGSPAAAPATVAEEVDLLLVSELADQFDCSLRVLMQNLKKVLGPNVILRLGNKYYIRKVRWRDYLVKLEEEV